jgi:hypothetical protein
LNPNWKLYLDDVRKRPKGFVLARSFQEAVELIEKMGCPSFISFDHDLGLFPDGTEKNGHDLAKWMVESDLDNKIKIPDDFKFNVHSSNPEGRKNIQGLLDNYLKFRQSQK